jgi:hypothetical protein
MIAKKFLVYINRQRYKNNLMEQRVGTAHMSIVIVNIDRDWLGKSVQAVYFLDTRVDSFWPMQRSPS